MINFFRYVLSATLLCGLLLGGCASSNVQRTSLNAMPRPLSVIVEEAHSSVDLDALRNVFEPNSPTEFDEIRVEPSMAEAEKGAMAEMQDALASVGMNVLSFDAIEATVNDTDQAQFASDLRFAQAKKLHKDSNADVLLRFRISDYGQTPKHGVTG